MYLNSHINIIIGNTSNFQLIFDQKAKNTHQKREHLQKLMLIKLDECVLRIQINPYLLLHAILKSKLIRNVIIKLEKLSLIEEKVGNIFEHISTGK